MTLKAGGGVVTLFFLLGIVASVGYGGYYMGKNGFVNPAYIPSPEPEISQPVFVSPIFQPKDQPQVKGAAIVKTPTVDCWGPDGKTFKATQVECDKFNAAWGTKRVTPTSIPQQGSSASVSTSTYTYVPKTYYLCTLCYHYPSGDSCVTYDHLYETKAECDAQQAQINLTTSVYVPPPAPTTPKETVEQCRAKVNQKYAPLFQSCTQYGGSTAQACTEIYTNQMHAEILACG